MAGCRPMVAAPGRDHDRLLGSADRPAAGLEHHPGCGEVRRRTPPRSRPGPAVPGHRVRAAQLSIRNPARAASRCSTRVMPPAGPQRRADRPVTDSTRAEWPGLEGDRCDGRRCRYRRAPAENERGREPGDEAHALDRCAGRQRPLGPIADDAHGIRLSGVLPEVASVPGAGRYRPWPDIKGIADLIVPRSPPGSSRRAGRAADRRRA